MDNIYKLAVKRGAYAGLAMIAWELLLIIQKWHNGAAGRYSYFLNIVVLAIAILVLFRDQNFITRKDSEPQFIDRLRPALFMSVTAAALYFLVTVVFYQVLFTGVIDQLVLEKEQLLRSYMVSNPSNEFGLNADTMQLKLNEFKNSFSFEGLFLRNFLSTLVQGSFMSLVISGAMKDTRGMFK